MAGGNLVREQGGPFSADCIHGCSLAIPLQVTLALCYQYSRRGTCKIK